MKGSKRLWLIAIVTVFTVIFGSPAAHAGITWAPTNGARQMNEPRNWNNNGDALANQITGDEYPGLNSVAVSNNGATNYLHSLVSTDGAGGAIDYNDLPGRTFAYPYFGGNIAYGGNNTPHNNTSAIGATPYYDGDCGVMRPHAYSDDFGVYKGGWVAETMTGSTGANAALTSPGGVTTLTIVNNAIAHFDGLMPGDRVQLGAATSALAINNWAPNVLNRTATGPATLPAGNTLPMSNGPYWRVATHNLYNTVTLNPDASIAVPATATYAAPNATFTSKLMGGDALFQGAAVGQRITVSGSGNATYNGTYQITVANAQTPWIFVAQPLAGGGAAPVGTMTSGNNGVVTRTTDNFLKANITAAAEVGTAATYTYSGPTGQFAVGETVLVSGMTPAGYNNGGVAFAVTAVGANTFTGTITAGGLGVGTAPFGISTIQTANGVTAGTLTRGSDCAKIAYSRSLDDGLNWDGGGTGAGATGCAPSATCGSSNFFNIAGGPTNGGTKTYLSEMGAGGGMVKTYLNYVYVTFFSLSGAPNWTSDVCPNDPRIMYIRTNDLYGAWDHWSAPVRITPAAGQVNWPTFTVDQANGNLYVLATDAISGDIQVYKSIDQGGTWAGPYVVDKSNYQYYSEFTPPDDPGGTPNNPAPCINVSRNFGGTGEDSWGYGETNRIGVYNNNIGVAYIKNAAGDRINAKISTSASPPTFPQVACPAAACAIVLTKGGAGGGCTGFGCAPGGPTTCPWDFGGTAAPIPCDDQALDPDIAVVAGASAAGTRIDFAWVQDGGVGTSGGTTTVTSNGLYFKEWQSTGGWGTTRLVACSKGNNGGPHNTGNLTNTTAAATGVASAAVNIGGKLDHYTWTYTVGNAAPYAAAKTVHFQGFTPDMYNGNFTITSRTATTIVVDQMGYGPGAATGFGTASLVNGAVDNDPCIGKVAATNYYDFEHPALALWGTTGVGMVFAACPNITLGTGNGYGPTPCTWTSNDPGEETLYKESGNSGAAWGADWSTAGNPAAQNPGAMATNGAFWRVATPTAATTNPVLGIDSDSLRSSWNPDVILDAPTDSATGCGQQAGGAPSLVPACRRYVFFISQSSGANPNYQSAYVQFIMRGTQT